MINTNMNVNAQAHFNTVAEIVNDIFGAIEAHLSIMTKPDTAVLVKYPDLEKSVTDMLDDVKATLKTLQDTAKGATEWAEELGYI